MLRLTCFFALACLVPVLAAASAPALVVMITVDQFRADYLQRYREHFGPGGLRRLVEEGAQFTDCRYRHGISKTACGHAVVLTGVYANQHGIINNAWVDRTTMKRVTCVEDPAVALLGTPDRGVRLPGVVKGSSPHRLVATTVGDELKVLRGPRAKVIGVSSKDRSAILLAGKLADAAYWMDKGRMVTSTHYLRELPKWVSAFNDVGRVDAYFGKTWDRVLPAAEYDKVVGPDDVEGESTDWGLARTFPKVVNGGAEKIGPVFYDAFECSPFKNEVLMDFARALVENENLGGRGVTDVLCLSFSTNDTIGHNYGPDSHEVMDITLRTDRLLAGFFDFLEARVGLKNCTIVFTADHGIPPLPERVKALNPNASAGRVDNVKLLKTCEAALAKEFGALEAGRHWLVIDENSLVLFQDVLREKKISPAAAENVVRDALLTLEFVELAYTRTEMLSGRLTGEYAEATRLSFHAERSGDLYYQMKPFWLDRKTGTNHGTPYTYDVHVPLLWLGAGVKPGQYSERVDVADIAPTLARIIGVLAPPMSQGRLLF